MLAAGFSFAQLPATITRLGIDLPPNTTRLTAADCEDALGTMAESFGYSEMECFLINIDSNLAFNAQRAGYLLAGYELIDEIPLTDELLLQGWGNREAGQAFMALYHYHEGALNMLAFMWNP